MAARRFVVVRRGSPKSRTARWSVHEGDEIYGEYMSEYAALLDAIDAAQEAGERGDSAEVAIREEGDQDSVRWVYGVDAYPPQIAVAEAEA
jgi:antirestriction protein